MAFVYHKDSIHKTDELSIDINNRAFCYGDGLFETIFIEHQNFKHLKYHFDRLSEGMKVLRLELENPLELPLLEKILTKLIHENEIKDRAKIKIYVWRKTGGLFTPENQTADLLIEAINSKEHKIQVLSKVKICKSIRLNYSILSKFKTLSSLNYVMAGIEKKEKDAEDLILLDSRDNISECISSNIFWIKDNIFFTPSLNTGCVAGTSRSRIIDCLKEQNIKSEIIEVKKEILFQANHIFTSNANGINKIAKIDNYKFSTDFNIDFLKK